MKSSIEFINPDGLIKNPAFSHVAITKGSGSTIYIGGQNAITAHQEIIGKGNITLQTEHVLKNIELGKLEFKVLEISLFIKESLPKNLTALS